MKRKWLMCKGKSQNVLINFHSFSINQLKDNKLLLWNLNCNEIFLWLEIKAETRAEDN